MFKRLKKKEIYKDRWVTFFQDEIEFSDGSKGTYAWVDRNSGVAIVVVTTDNRILLNKEYRYVVGKYSWEVPGGGIDEGESPKEAAIRELHEETGLKAENLVEVGSFFNNISFNTEKISVFYVLVESAESTTINTELGEQVDEQRYVSFSEALKMIDDGKIIDAMTSNVLQIVIRRSQKHLSKSE